MSKQPFFASAPRIALFIDSARVGYAIGLTLNISVAVEPIKVLGMFETLTLEPLAYLPVSGSMRILKLIPKDMQAEINKQAALQKDPFVNADTAPGVLNIGNSVQVADQTKLYSHVTPGTLLLSSSFDIEIQIKTIKADIQKKINAAATQRESALSAAYLNKNNAANADQQIAAMDAYNKAINDKYDPNATEFNTWTRFMTIKDCRITGMDSEISPARLMEEAVTYQGLIAINSNEAMDFINELK
jgi:hypothetical protein